MSLAEAINADRGRRGETVAQWSDRHGISRRTVEDWIRRDPAVPMAQLLARLLSGAV